MRTKILISSFVTLLLSAIIFNSSSVSAATVSVSPGDNIQAAIDGATAGDTIAFAPGTYLGSPSVPININKALTLQGAKAGVDARNRSGAESIIQTAPGQNRMFNINSDNVTIDGFTFDGSTGDPSVAIDVHPTSAVNTHILNNVLTHTSSAIMFTSTNITGLRISQNLFDANNASGQSSGIFVSNSSGSDIEISSNTFRNTDANTAGSAAVAINIFATAPAYDNLRVLNNTSDNDGAFIAVDSASNVTISNNVVTNEVKSAITIDANVDTVTISGNTLSNSLMGIRLRGAYDVAGASPITGVTATNNTISGMSVAGVQVMADAIGDSPLINNNSLTGNAVGVANASTVQVNANNNWWGCAQGQNTPGCDTTSGSVQASVWYTDAARTTLNTTNVQVVAPGAPNTGVRSAAMGSVVTLIGGFIAVLGITAGVFMCQSYKKINYRRKL